MIVFYQFEFQYLFDCFHLNQIFFIKFTIMIDLFHLHNLTLYSDFKDYLNQSCSKTT